MRTIKKIIPQIIINQINKLIDERKFKNWKANGCPVPPPHKVKQNIIAEYQERYNCKVLVETGTCYGDMVEAQKNRFDQIISIELSKELSNFCKKRFQKIKNVTIVQGDSGRSLNTIVKSLDKPAIFWLDGHYSGGETAKGETECPIFEELNAIFSNSSLNHVLLIDDARLFNGKGDYPTIENLTEFIKDKNKNYKFEVDQDVIRYTFFN